MLIRQQLNEDQREQEARLTRAVRTPEGRRDAIVEAFKPNPHKESVARDGGESIRRFERARWATPKRLALALAAQCGRLEASVQSLMPTQGPTG